MQADSVMLCNRTVLKFATRILLCCSVSLPALALHDTSGPDASAAPNELTIAKQRADERNRLREEEQEVRSLAREQESQCYQRFAVEDCLRAVRRQQRQSVAQLRQREMALNDQERQERADERRQSIAQKQSQHRSPASAEEKPRLATVMESGPVHKGKAAAQRAQRQSEQANRASDASERQESEQSQ